METVKAFFIQGLKSVGRQLVQLSSKPATEWLMLFVCLLPFVLISVFNHPTDDDFLDAVLARQQGFWKSMGFYYQHWTGRYTSSFLYGLVYKSATLDSWLLALRLAPVILLISLTGAGYFAIGGLGLPISASMKWRFALYGVLLYLCGIPLVASALYWFNGAAVYTSGLILGLLLAGLIGRCIHATSSADRVIWGILAAINGALLVGTNELMIVVTLIVVTVWLLGTTGPKKHWPLVVLIAASIGAIITVAAPGNFARADTVLRTMPLWYQIGRTGAKSIYLTISHIADWGSNGLLLSATVLFVWWVRPRYPSAYTGKWLRGAAVGGMVMVIMAMPTLWITNDVPARVWNVVYLLFLLCWFAGVLAAISRRPLPASWRVTGRNGRRLRVLWLVLIVLGYNNAVHSAYIDVAFKAQRYNRAQDQRYALLQQLQRMGRHDVEVQALLPHEYQYPGTIFLHELELFPNDIANEGMAAYFGLDSVRIKSLPARIRRHMRE
ncbi:hypothetical protein SAMN04488069_1128 [Hymenobacter psychrophilus]|uniref:4-amino-4-deoxy-L-arabinose transferase n=2 Tax=Hymenobacter psychrophilus TaxID=651662 RepID=A0A1H3M383_9BACT|nr:hypothetical protein SAMN04488069_1128 [Hymenobacter psychrophilus]